MTAWVEQHHLGSKVRIEVVDEHGNVAGLVGSMMKVVRSKIPRRTVICFGAGLKGLLWVLLCRIGGVKILLRLGGDEVYIFRELAREAFRSRRWLEGCRYFSNHLSAGLVVQAANALIVVSEQLGSRIRNRSRTASSHAVFVVHQPLTELFAKRENPHLPLPRTEKVINLLTVTNLKYRDKLMPLMTIIDALSSGVWLSCRDSSQTIEYTVAGGGSHLGELMQYAGTAAPELAKRNIALHVLGHIDDLHPLYSKADLFVYGSLSDGVPNAVLEAQWYGLPIVANDSADFGTLLKSGTNAILHRTGDAEDAARALCELIRDGGKRQEIGLKNYRDVRERFGLTTVLDQLGPVMRFCGALQATAEKD